MAYFKKYSTKNKGDLWLFKIDVGIDPGTGNRKTTTRRGFKTKREAQEVARLMETQREDGTLAIERQDALVKDYLEEWLVVFKQGTVRENTYKQYQNAVFKHLIPALGYFKVKEISQGMMQKTINELADSKLSRRSVEIILQVMSNAANKAIELKIVRDNFCRGVKIPNKKIVAPKKKHVGNFLTKEEIPMFLEAARSIHWRYYLGFKIMIYMGYRKGETFGLWPEDIDFDSKMITINRTLHFDKEELEDMFGPPKTDASYRESLADDMLLFEIKKQISFRKQAIFAMRDEYRSETNLLICRGNGQPVAKSTLHRAFKAALKKSGITREVTVHGLRHTHAVMMLESGASLKEVQEKLGHSSLDVSADVYSHITEKIERRSVDNFIAYLNQ
ncbi:site-specific integrase [Paenibacillus campi]|uniref:site-specific integrase n=1 Tax=Paenibacillus campi TaxID=3106031 RepID=UPI002AFF6CCE|nr:site-specific integrase [Paenibacillus sp. SGZ-1014]